MKTSRSSGRSEMGNKPVKECTGRWMRTHYSDHTQEAEQTYRNRRRSSPPRKSWIPTESWGPPSLCSAPAKAINTSLKFQGEITSIKTPPSLSPSAFKFHPSAYFFNYGHQNPITPCLHLMTEQECKFAEQTAFKFPGAWERLLTSQWSHWSKHWNRQQAHSSRREHRTIFPSKCAATPQWRHEQPVWPHDTNLTTTNRFDKADVIGGIVTC